MSFRCGICKRAQEDGTMAERRVTHYRPVTYQTRTFIYKKSKHVYTKDTVGQGWEIAREALCCPICDEQLSEPQAVEGRTVPQTQTYQKE